MDFQIKLFSWPERGNHLIMITRGLLDMGALEQIFQEVATVTRALLDCKVVIDLQDALCNLKTTDIQAFVHGRNADGWSSHKIAMLSPQEIEQYDQGVYIDQRSVKAGFQNCRLLRLKSCRQLAR